MDDGDGHGDGVDDKEQAEADGFFEQTWRGKAELTAGNNNQS